MKEENVALDAMKEAFEKLAKEQGDLLITRFRGLVKTNKPITGKVADALRDASQFEAKAVLARDSRAAEEFRASRETALRRAKTLALSEAVVASDEAAEWFEAAAKATIVVLGEAAKIALSVAARKF